MREMNRLYLNRGEFISIDKLKNLSFEHGQVPDYVTSIHCPLSASEDVSFECEVNAQAFSKMMGVDLAQRGDLTGFTLECTSPYQVQIRRHRKKRINKKWAKRYGYVTMFKTVKMTGAQFIQNETDFEFIGR